MVFGQIQYIMQYNFNVTLKFIGDFYFQQRATAKMLEFSKHNPT